MMILYILLKLITLIFVSYLFLLVLYLLILFHFPNYLFIILLFFYCVFLFLNKNQLMNFLLFSYLHSFSKYSINKIEKLIQI